MRVNRIRGTQIGHNRIIWAKTSIVTGKETEYYCHIKSDTAPIAVNAARGRKGRKPEVST